MQNGKVPVPCCGPCEGVGYCRIDASCCCECHCALEENLVRPYLPPEIFAILQAEHNRLEAAAFPPAELIEHSIWEEALFEEYQVPVEIRRQISVDHSEFEQGRLRSRAAVMR